MSGGHGHDHSHGQDHLFEYRTVEKRKLQLSLSITLVVMVIEFIGGFLTNSIALISDGWHMFTHAFAISIGLVAIIIASRPPCHHRTFGLFRAEVLAAFINGLFLILVAVIIIMDSVDRILNPLEVIGFQMLLIAILGLAVNLASIYILHGSHKTDLNIKGVFAHMVVDAVSSVGVLTAALIIYYTDWFLIDPLVSIGISVVILYWAAGIIRESSVILLEMTPRGLDIDEIEASLKEEFPEIKQIVNSHCWTITTDMTIFSSHIQVADDTDRDDLIYRISNYLNKHYKIAESTLQLNIDEVETACIVDHVKQR